MFSGERLGSFLIRLATKQGNLFLKLSFNIILEVLKIRESWARSKTIPSF
jgi:hypothetical protein